MLEGVGHSYHYLEKKVSQNVLSLKKDNHLILDMRVFLKFSQVQEVAKFAVLRFFAISVNKITFKI
jgi:hypothetical protein